jgi:hypothetical protein
MKPLVKYPHNTETHFFITLSFLEFTTHSFIRPSLCDTLTMANFYHQETPIYYSDYNSYWEPQLPPSIHIHPESPAGQLGLTPEELEPILRKQQEFLRNELAQPPPTLTRSTSTYHLGARAEPQPNPTSLSPQQEATWLGINPEELAAISEESVCEQAKWLAKDQAKWREREEKRWRGKVREDRDIGEKENRKRTEEAE